jgi:ppGpp synthetase/RelA/SpoT-type nucleotidyltranferase
MHSWEPEGLRSEYLSRQEHYSDLEEIVHKKLEVDIRKIGINCDIQSRFKDVESFIKKALRKKYESPLTEIKDQLGFRVITTYVNDLSQISEVIHKEFRVSNFEDKLDSLEYNQLGYLGIHFEVSLQESAVDQSKKHYDEFIFEIQLHTRAQNLWATISHQLSYKPSSESPSIEVQRSIYRLVALIEIFDKEVSNAQNAILNQPSFPEAMLLRHLEKYFYLFSAKGFDREFSIQNLLRLKNLLKEKEIDDFENLIQFFVEKNNEKLSSIFFNYSNDKRDSYKLLILSQPESLLIFERLDQDMFKLKELWETFLPMELLECLAVIWGVNLPTT